MSHIAICARTSTAGWRNPRVHTGNLVLHRLTEIGAEIEIIAQGGVVVHIPVPEGQENQGRGTLCSLSALTNMLLRGDAQKILKPSSVKRWEE